MSEARAQLPMQLPDPLLAVAALTGVSSTEAIGTRPAMAATTLHDDDGEPFRLFEALFGRDSLVIARLLAPRWSAIQPTTFVALAALQGLPREIAPDPDAYERRLEQPGRILHEMRDPTSDPVGRRLVEEQGWSFPYFHSDDATPAFVRDLARTALKRPTLLNDAVVQRDGTLRSLADALAAGLRHVVGLIAVDGLIMSHRPARIPGGGMPSFPVWQDSPDAYFRNDGALVEGPIAALEVQTQTLDALLACGRLVERVPDLAAVLGPPGYLRDLARVTANATLDWFWDDPMQCFAAGIERTPQGLVRTGGVKSAAGALLDSSLLIDAAHRHTVRTLVETLFDPASGLVTPWGLRTLSAVYDCDRYRPGAYHNGSVWLHDNHLIALGLRRHGFHGLATWLDHRVVAICEQLHCYPEFIRGDSLARPEVNQHILDVDVHDAFAGAFVNRIEQPPQLVQGWALSAYLSARRNLERSPEVAPNRAQRSYEAMLMEQLRSVDVFPAASNVALRDVGVDHSPLR